MTDHGRDSDTHERDELSSAERLSSAPSQEQSDAVVGIGLLGWLRWGWRQLTSMRVALILLFLLSLAAVPGSIVPQTSASPLNVAAWHSNHKSLAPLFDKLGMFHVYSSFWFSAIYILLFVSLVGCIIPRTWQFVGVLRAKPPAAPRHLVRLPVYATWRTGADAATVLEASEALLRRKRFRSSRAGDAIASEKGYLREVGNLLFHIALVAMLIAFAFTKLAGGMGTVIVVEGKAFSNNVTQYDDFSPSTFYTADSLNPFGFRLDSFDASYQTSGPAAGQASYFAALVSYWDGSDPSRKTSGRILVNHPLEVGGDNVYLTAHGFAPVIQVTNAQGKVIFDGPTPCLPQDSNMTSLCAIKVNDGYTDKGKKTQLGFSGIFAPTMADPSQFVTQGPHSVFPAPANPQLSITGYEGDLRDSSGIPQSVYDLDTSHMTQFTLDKQPLKFLLSPQQGFKLPSGGTVTFTGVKQWANFTVAHNPGTSAALVSSVLAILGLIGSLFVQRRRIWVRAVTGPDGVTTVELAGLARSESSRIAEELAEIALDLQDSAPVDESAAGDASADDTSSDHETAGDEAESAVVHSSPSTSKER
ncbi:cytochrome c biogenesis protein ResB [Streptacidiphilus sp. EB129]|uniref:cytochrome c biogenesis protein ResB n=1 Tax=Streptacidiphilus sp. EB129 TaxID=3156262 RepID=UPI003514AE0B